MCVCMCSSHTLHYIFVYIIATLSFFFISQAIFHAFYIFLIASFPVLADGIDNRRRRRTKARSTSRRLERERFRKSTRSGLGENSTGEQNLTKEKTRTRLCVSLPLSRRRSRKQNSAVLPARFARRNKRLVK